MKTNLTMRGFQNINHERCDMWHSSGSGSWTLADWGNALAGEAGEACNLIKKARRIETGVGGNTKGEEWGTLLEQIGVELADVVTYAFLTASQCGIDLEDAIVDKFNLVSEKQGLPQRIQLELNLVQATTKDG